MSRVVQCFAGGKGSVRHNASRVKGLRNKRRAHWARERKMEDILAEKKAKAQALIDESYGDEDWDR
jgi:hypothetical protein